MELNELTNLFKNESAFWSNNKRKINGLPLRRKHTNYIIQLYIDAKESDIVADMIIAMPSLQKRIYEIIEKEKQYDKRKI